MLGGEQRGPLSRDGLRALLDTHPDGWAAPVWRLGMLDWRAASSVSALNAAASPSQPPLVRTSAPLDGPPRVTAPRNTAGELRVLSYGELKAHVREMHVESSPPPANTPGSRSPDERSLRLELPDASAASATSLSSGSPNLAVSNEWAAVGTSELSAIGTSELRALSLAEKQPAETSEWTAVGTSELRAVGTSELRALTLVEPSAAKTVHELPVLKPDALRESALPSMIVSDQTSTELPSFDYRAQSEPPARPPEAPSPAPQGVTPTPRSLPAYSPKPASRPPSRAPYVMAGLLVLSATAFGTVLTVRSLRAYEAQASRERSYRPAPPPPRAAQPGPAPVASSPVPALPAAERASPAEIAVAPSPDPVRAPAPAAPPRSTTRRSDRQREAERARESVAARTVDRVRISAASAPVRVGNHAQAKVVCTLARGTVRSVLTVLPGAQGRWFAVHCDDQSVGWLSEVEARGSRVER